jgi:integrase
MYGKRVPRDTPGTPSMKRLTEAIAASLRDRAITTGKDVYEFDSQAPGYFLRATPAGVVTHNAQARVAGRKLKITLGYQTEGMSVVDGRELARLALADLREGRDPALERRARQQAAIAAGITVAAFAETWMATYVRLKLKAKTAADYEQQLRRHILPAVGHRPLADLSFTDANALHVKMERTPRAANYTIATLGGMMEHAIKAGLRSDNPCRQVTNYPERRRERFLSRREFALAIEAIEGAAGEGAISTAAGAALKFALYSGARRSEICATRWGYVDWDRRLVRLPDSKANTPRTIHLNAQALAVLRGLPRSGVLVFGGKLRWLTAAWETVRARCGLDDVRLHDCRHSFASLALGAGVPLAMVGKLLGHRRASTTERYAHLAADDVAAANDAVGEALAVAIAPGGSVVKLATKRRRRR